MNKIKQVLKKYNIKYKEIRNALDIKSNSTVSLKLNGKSNFTTKEALLLKELIENKSGIKFSMEDLFDEETGE